METAGSRPKDDVSLPKATMTKIIKEMLPPDVRVAKDVVTHSGEFINLISSESNEICSKEEKRTIAPEHVLRALDILGFGEYIGEVQAAYEQHKNETLESPKVGGRWAKEARGGMTEEEALCDLHPQLLQHQSRIELNYATKAEPEPVPTSGFLESVDISGSPIAVAPTVPPRVPIISHLSSISYRKIRPSDLEVLQEMHEALFPIKYETEFFMNVIDGRGIISWAAVDTSRSDSHCDDLIGFVTARVISASECDELDMLGYEISSSERSLIYILTLGVIPPYRNSGIASALLWEVIECANQMSSIRALYLHVIDYNHPAIMFYQKNMFQCIRRLHNFYFIDGQHHDAYLHVYYVNGGRSPCTSMYSLKAAYAQLRGLFASLAGRLF